MSCKAKLIHLFKWVTLIKKQKYFVIVTLALHWRSQDELYNHRLSDLVHPVHAIIPLKKLRAEFMVMRHRVMLIVVAWLKPLGKWSEWISNRQSSTYRYHTISGIKRVLNQKSRWTWEKLYRMLRILPEMRIELPLDWVTFIAHLVSVSVRPMLL
jgi:hypothetical protein